MPSEVKERRRFISDKKSLAPCSPELAPIPEWKTSHWIIQDSMTSPRDIDPIAFALLSFQSAEVAVVDAVEVAREARTAELDTLSTLPRMLLNICLRNLRLSPENLSRIGALIIADENNSVATAICSQENIDWDRVQVR